jgi:hypothetical protein
VDSTWPPRWETCCIVLHVVWFRSYGTTILNANISRHGGASSLLVPQAGTTFLSIGLSTKEMPPNNLVGAWKGSVGLCTTGQLLTAGQWCSPVDPSQSAFGVRSTIGCLVCLDDGSAFETWDGVMVTASCTFTVNDRIVSPPAIMGRRGGGSFSPQSQPTPPRSAAATPTMEWNPPSTAAAPTLSPQPPPISLSSSPPSSIPRCANLNVPPPPSFTLPLLVPAEEELYPTVTLHSPSARVLCRFSAADILATSRETLGAPPGVTIYAVDGSVIF